ncbi:MAG: hypothetical protein IPL95_10580 [Saprospiraceae bacterium]|nr:hypothetical protein [Saprospiraceae bacterium]
MHHLDIHHLVIQVIMRMNLLSTRVIVGLDSDCDGVLSFMDMDDDNDGIRML